MHIKLYCTDPPFEKALESIPSAEKPQLYDLDSTLKQEEDLGKFIFSNISVFN